MGKLAMLMLEDLNNAIRNKDLPLIKEVIEREMKILMIYTLTSSIPVTSLIMTHS